MTTSGEAMPNEVETAKKVPETASGLTKSSPKAKDKLAAPSVCKKGPESEEKGAGEGIPAICLIPPTPESKPNSIPEDDEGQGEDSAEKKKPSEEKQEGKVVETQPKESKKDKTEAEPANIRPTPSVQIDMSSKASIRNATWNRLEETNCVLFPRPCYKRTPRFKGEDTAVEKLAQLDIFKNAKLVKVNLDKAQEKLRLVIVQSGKELVAGTPGLREAVFLVMHPPLVPNEKANRTAASRMGMYHLGMALDFQAKRADLVVLCSVAVDMKGRRIGKGEGFSDLEYALLCKMGTITPDVIIVTIVHDEQVYDEFPESIFQPYDVPVDVIITPTRVINVEKKLERPALRWDLLSQRRVDDIPIIKQLLDKEKSSGAKIQLKEVDTDTEESPHYPPMSYRRPKRFGQYRRQTSISEPRGDQMRNEKMRGGMMRGQRRRESSAPPPYVGNRTFHRQPRMRRQTSTSNESPKSDRQRKSRKSMRRGGPLKRITKPRYTVDFSVKVNGLSSAVRIRDLKAALVERGVRPSDISWRATKGIAILHFAKRRQIQQNQQQGLQTEQQRPTSVEVQDVVALLQGLSVKPDDGPRMDLMVEVATPLPPRGAGPQVCLATA